VEDEIRQLKAQRERSLRAEHRGAWIACIFVLQFSLPFLTIALDHGSLDIGLERAAFSLAPRQRQPVAIAITIAIAIAWST
jgi:hypothetical protein